MKRLVSLFSLILLASASFAQNDTQSIRRGWNVEGIDLVGPVQSVTISEYSLVDIFGEITRGELNSQESYLFSADGDVLEYRKDDKRTTYKYDRNKCLIEKVDYNQAGVDSLHKYKIGNAGHILEESVYGGNGSLVRKIVRKYDGNNKQIAVAEYCGDGALIYKCTYKYDDESKLLERIKYDDNGKILERVTNSYNYKGEICERTILIGAQETVIEYGKYGQVTKESQYKDGVLGTLRINKYDRARRLTNVKVYECRPESYDNYEADSQSNRELAEVLVSDIIYTYNSNGDLVEELSNDYALGGRKRTTYVYDKDLRLIERIYYNAYGALEVKHIFEYDENGNVVLQSNFAGEILLPLSVVEYEITYDPTPKSPANAEGDGEVVGALVQEVEDNSKIHLVADVMPSFQGGDIYTFREWMLSELKYPERAKEIGMAGRVIVKFVVEMNGSISNVEILKSTSTYFSDEVLRVLELSPRWSPGLFNGEPCRVAMVLPITFEYEAYLWTR